jgi:hypothetical protein
MQDIQDEYNRRRLFQYDYHQQKISHINLRPIKSDLCLKSQSNKRTRRFGV